MLEFLVLIEYWQDLDMELCCMQYRSLGVSEIQASVIGFGSWAIGGWLWGGTDRAQAIEAIHSAIDSGINFIDTAPAYGFGLSEEIIASAIVGQRDKLVIASKCGLIWDRKAETIHYDTDCNYGCKDTQYPAKIYRCLDPKSIAIEVEQSLKRLKTDYIDLYQVHWQESVTPIDQTMDMLLSLKKQGKIRAIGLSNVSVDNIKQYKETGIIDTDQEKFSMLERNIDKVGISDYCNDNNIAILAYSPLAQGLLTGTVSMDREFPHGDLRREHLLFTADSRRQISELLEKIRPIALDKSITLAQLVIAWTLSQTGITHALCGARNQQQAIENAIAGSVSLSLKEIEHISACVDAYPMSE